MKRKNKLLLGIVGLASVALFASGCTANFSTNEEKSRIAYAFEPGVSQFVVGPVEASDSKVVTNVGGNVYQVYSFTKDENGNITDYSYSKQLKTIISSAKSSAIGVPSIEYFVNFDKKVFERAITQYNVKKDPDVSLDTISQEALSLIMEDYGYVKFFGNDDTFGNYRAINNELREEADSLTAKTVASVDFENFYISTMSTLVESYKSTITVYPEYKYGNYGEDSDTSIILKKVTWKDAWGKGGHLIEGLIVYPVAYMIDGFARAFAGGKTASVEDVQRAYSSGVPQILSILVVTVIVRLFIFLCTFKSILTQKKMTELQPELAKIQQKYPNANTNQAQKQRLAEEQMRLYKKHHVNPLSQLLVLIIQFPVFIGVWGAMTGAAVLSTGKFLGLHLSASIWETLKIGTQKGANPGFWTALVLIFLMSAGQFFAMKVPQWIQKAKTKKVSRLGTNPAQKQQNRTANIVSYVMLIMIIVMGFTLPAAMGVYWFVGAIVSLIQTLFTNVIFAGNKKKK